MIVYDFENLSVSYLLPYLRTIPELVAVMKLIGKRFNAIQTVLLALLNSYDISNCKGKMLDFAGEEVGASRDSITIDNFFALNLFHINENKYFYFSSSGESPYKNLSLEDSEYLQKIYTYISKNTTFSTFEELIRNIKIITNSDTVFLTNSDSELVLHLYGDNIFLTGQGLNNLRDIVCEGIYIKEIKINE